MRSLNFDNKTPLLYLIATPIGNLSEFSSRALDILKEIDLVACEDTRVTGKLLSVFGLNKPLISVREHNETEESEKLVKKILRGLKVAYVSDAGYPCISDPGARLVKICIENGVNVSCISGPNAALNALVASGLDATHFYFHGFLNAKDSARKQELEKLKDRPETLIFYEAPHRIQKTLQSLLKVFGNRKACIARELTKKHEEFIRGSLEELNVIDPETLIGEMVIIVEGYSKEPEEQLNDKEIIKLVDESIESGLSAKDAIKKVAEAIGVSKNDVYSIYHSK